MDKQSTPTHIEGYQILSADHVDPDALCSLYDSVGWSAYTDNIHSLLKAVDGSDYVVVAKDEHMLVGLARAISDDASIVYIQDILVHPNHQGRGLGKALVSAVLHRYEDVRQVVLLTDDRPEQLQFYASLGFKNTADLVKTPLNAFVMIKGTALD